MSAEKEALVLGPLESGLYFGLLSEGRWVVSTSDAARREEITHNHAAKLLHALHRKGLLTRVGRGIYAVASPTSLAENTPTVDPYRVIDQLMKLLGIPYYIGFASAVHLHGASDEIPFTIQVATVRQRRPLRVAATPIKFHQVAADRFFGIVRVRQSGEFVSVSDPEKTLLDCAERPNLCGGLHGLIGVSRELAHDLDLRRLREHARRMGPGPSVQRLGFVLMRLRMARKRIIPPEAPAALSLRRKLGPYPLDPSRPRRGREDRKWRIIVNGHIPGWADG